MAWHARHPKKHTLGARAHNYMNEFVDIIDNKNYRLEVVDIIDLNYRLEFVDIIDLHYRLERCSAKR